MDENAIQNHILDLKVSNARLNSEVQHLTLAVESLVSKVDEISSSMQHSKGAIATLISLSSLMGALITHVLHSFVGGK